MVLMICFDMAMVYCVYNLVDFIVLLIKMFVMCRYLV